MEHTLNINEKRYIEKTLKNYEIKEQTKLDKLRYLDRKAKTGATITAYVLGIIGALVLGAGMSIAMVGFAGLDIFIGIVIGIKGLFMVGMNYLLYKKNLKKGKAKYANQILELSKELLNEEN